MYFFFSVKILFLSSKNIWNIFRTFLFKKISDCTYHLKLQYQIVSYLCAFLFFADRRYKSPRYNTRTGRVGRRRAYSGSLLRCKVCVYIICRYIYICNVGAAAEQLLYRRCAVFPGGDAWHRLWSTRAGLDIALYLYIRFGKSIGAQVQRGLEFFGLSVMYYRMYTLVEN